MRLTPAILEVLYRADRPLSSTEIAEAAGATPNATKVTLHRMMALERVTRVEGKNTGFVGPRGIFFYTLGPAAGPIIARLKIDAGRTFLKKV